MRENNKVQLIGVAVENFEYSYSVANETFYTTMIKVQRLSGNCDYAELMVSDKIIDITRKIKGKCFAVNGEVRTYNNKEVMFNKLKVYVLVDTLDELLVSDDLVIGENIVKLRGFVCKRSELRETPFGRQICDVILAVNREGNRSSYVPLIFWNKLAQKIQKLPIGTEIEIDGRFQSRNYIKQIENQEVELMAYEISVQNMNCL